MDLPDSLAPLFHNHELRTVSASKHASLVIITTLSRGTWEQIRDVFAMYGWARIEEIVCGDMKGLRTLPDAVANFWSIVFWGRPLSQRSAAERWAATRGAPKGGRTHDPVKSDR